MSVGHEISDRRDRLLAGIETAYGIKADTLEAALKRIKGRLPRKLAGQVDQIVAAEKFGGNPKLLRRMDNGTLLNAANAFEAHLSSIDRAALRQKAMLNWAAQAGFYVLLVFGAVFVWAVTTGRL